MHIQMFQDLSIINCISRLQVEILTFLLLLIGQRFIRVSYFQKGKYSENLAQNQYQAEQVNSSFDRSDSENNEQNFSDISNSQTIRIMNKFVKLGKIDLAEQIFKQILTPCIQTYTIMIKGYSKINELAKSTEIYNTMISQGLQPTIVTYNTYLTCALKCKNLELAHQIMTQIKEKDVVTYSTYIRGLLRMNKIEQAINLHEYVLQQKDLILDEMYFDVLINGLVKNKQIILAIQIFKQMKQQDFEINDFSVSVIIQLLSKLDNNQIIQFFKDFKKKDVFLFNRILNQMLTQNNTIQQACELIKESINQKIMLKKTVYENCINALYLIITHQVIKDGLTVSYAQDTLLAVINYTVKRNIQIKNENMSEIVPSYEVKSFKNKNDIKLYERCVAI